MNGNFELEISEFKFEIAILKTTFRRLLLEVGGEADEVAVPLDKVDGHALPEGLLHLGLEVELLLRPHYALAQVLQSGTCGTCKFSQCYNWKCAADFPAQISMGHPPFYVLLHCTFRRSTAEVDDVIQVCLRLSRRRDVPE